MGLKDLSLLRATPGREEAVRQHLLDTAVPEGATVIVDPMGNLLVGRGLKKKGPVLFMAAHMDEVGFLVTSHEADGTLRFRPSGGVDPRVVVGKPVLVGDEPIPGVIGVGPAHLARGEDLKPFTYDDLWIDIGARDGAEARRLVPPGSMVTFDTPFTEQGRTVQGKAFDDRSGCATAVAALTAEVESPVWVGFTVQEEIGLRGARIAARRIQPDYFVTLEGTVAADVPGSEGGRHVSSVHGGPVLSVVDRSAISDRSFSQAIRRLAADIGVPCQDRRTMGGSNDAAEMWPEGATIASISLPCRYIHSPSAVTGRDDLDNTAKLARAVASTIREVAS